MIYKTQAQISVDQAYFSSVNVFLIILRHRKIINRDRSSEI
jgi:hypothetical protein